MRHVISANLTVSTSLFSSEPLYAGTHVFQDFVSVSFRQLQVEKHLVRTPHPIAIQPVEELKGSFTVKDNREFRSDFILVKRLSDQYNVPRIVFNQNNPGYSPDALGIGKVFRRDGRRRAWNLRAEIEPRRVRLRVEQCAKNFAAYDRASGTPKEREVSRL
jgi:hypothetical protein